MVKLSLALLPKKLEDFPQISFEDSQLWVELMLMRPRLLLTMSQGIISWEVFVQRDFYCVICSEYIHFEFRDILSIQKYSY